MRVHGLAPWLLVPWGPCFWTQWALVVVAISRVAADRASSGRRFIGCCWVLSSEDGQVLLLASALAKRYSRHSLTQSPNLFALLMQISSLFPFIIFAKD